MASTILAAPRTLVIRMAATDTVTPSKRAAATPTLDRSQIVQLVEWHDKAKTHEVAHAKLATRDKLLGTTLAVMIGVLGVFSGTVWTVNAADAGVPSDLVKWIAAAAGFAVAVLVALSKSADFTAVAAKHDKASALFGKPRSELEKLKADGGFKSGLTQKQIDDIGEEYFQGLDCEVDASRRILARAEQQVARERWGADLIPVDV
jgi:hypothetical protein